MNKYRIYDTQEKEYVEEPDHRWMLSREGKLYNSEIDEWYTPGERYIVEFHTSQKDNDGKEIYAGDILRFGNGFDAKNGSINVVRYIPKNAGFLIKDKWGSYQFLYDICQSANSYLIGNVHKNPELLTENYQQYPQ